MKPLFITSLVSALGLAVLGVTVPAQTMAPAVPAPPALTANVRTNSVRVSGDVSKPRTWTPSQLQGLAPVETIHTTLKGQPYTARGVRLWSLIQAAGPRLDPKTKHSEARFVVLARGKDGYLVSFALADLMPEVGNQNAFLIWEAGGKPLSVSEGPFRLIIPGDKKPMRWLYGLVALEVYDGKRLRSGVGVRSGLREQTPH